MDTSLKHTNTINFQLLSNLPVPTTVLLGLLNHQWLSNEGPGLTQGHRVQGLAHQMWGEQMCPGPGSWSWFQIVAAVGKS